jgi:hypothetical protein
MPLAHTQRLLQAGFVLTDFVVKHKEKTVFLV